MLLKHPASKSENSAVITLRKIAGNKKGLFGGVVLLWVIAMATTAPFLPLHDPVAVSMSAATFPTLDHPLGTDRYGRDILSRIVWGARISIFVGIISVGIAIIIGVPLGVVAGFYRGLVDEGISRMADALMSFPSILLALVFIAVFGTGMDKLMTAIGIVFTPSYIRLTRASVLSVREKEFVLGAMAVGDTDIRIMFKEILPNVSAPIIVQATIGFSFAILFEAGLSFLGLGIQPPTPSWGGMLSESQGYLETAPWLSIFPGLAILITVLALNMFGDALRDVLDPRLRIG